MSVDGLPTPAPGRPESRMHRKRFLTWMAATPWGLAGRAVAAPPRARTRLRVVVIGAGLAGLAAAHALRSDGHEVVVVEARDRVGGRIWTSRAWPDLPVDLGASWIHGTSGNPLTALADSAGAARLVTRYERAVTYGPSGRPLTDDEERRLAQVRSRLLGAIRRTRSQDDDLSVRQAIEPVVAGFAHDSDERRFAAFVVQSELEQEYAGSAARLSAHRYDEADAFGGDDVLFAEGFGALTDHLAHGLDIRLGQVVREVHGDRSPVRVVTQDAVHEADRVLVTLPLGVLQAGTVRFSPALPRAKVRAIDTLGMGVLNKCVLRFERPFWPQDVDWLQHVAPTPDAAWPEWVSFWRAARWPVLLGFQAADAGRAIEDRPDEAIVADAMRTLRTVFGARIPEPTGFQLTRWARDPFARGSYSYNAVGSTPDLRHALAAPLGDRVYFAGEATHASHFGTAHGAWLSGVRAARDLRAAA